MNFMNTKNELTQINEKNQIHIFSLLIFINDMQNENQDLKVKILLYNKENSNNISVTQEET